MTAGPIDVPNAHSHTHSQQMHAQGIDGGNCNWEAAFDAPSAYLLVHMHHYADLSPQECFDRLHEAPPCTRTHTHTHAAQV